MRNRRNTLLALAIGAVASSACGGGSSGSSGNDTPTPTSPGTPNTPQANTVTATTNITFEPGVLTVAPGESVTFSFQGVGHNVFFDAKTGAPTDIPQILSNTTVARTFSATGSFGYECHVHPGMRGTVVVQ